MTGPGITNEQLVAQAQDIDMEEQESQPIVQAISDKFSQISAQLGDALKFAADDSTRSQLQASLRSAKDLSDQNQAILNALLAPPAGPSSGSRKGKK